MNKDLKIVKYETLLGSDNYHVIHKEKANSYITGYGWGTPERALVEYRWRLANDCPIDCEIEKVRCEEI